MEKQKNSQQPLVSSKTTTTAVEFKSKLQRTVQAISKLVSCEIDNEVKFVARNKRQPTNIDERNEVSSNKKMKLVESKLHSSTIFR